MANRNDTRKLKFAEKLNYLLDSHEKVMTVGLDNVGSKALSDTRKQLRLRNIHMLKGKNTLTRKVLHLRAEKQYSYGKKKLAEETLKLLSMVSGNVGFLFMPMNVTPEKLCEELTGEKVVRAAKAGMVAPCDVFVNPGPTRCDPTTTAVFQNLGFSTKIQSGQVQILSRLRVVKAGEKVSQSAAEILAMLNIKPFQYGLTGQHIYEDGVVLPAKSFEEVRQGIFDAYRNVLALGLALEDYSWPNLEVVRDRLKHAPVQADTDVDLNQDPFTDDETDDSTSTGGPNMWDEDTDSESDSSDSESQSEESS